MRKGIKDGRTGEGKRGITKGGREGGRGNGGNGEGRGERRRWMERGMGVDPTKFGRKSTPLDGGPKAKLQ